MNAGRLLELAAALGCERPEIRVRINGSERPSGEYRYTVAVLHGRQVSGEPFASYSANRDEHAAECVEKDLEGRVREKLREAEREANRCRTLLGEDDGVGDKGQR